MKQKRFFFCDHGVLNVVPKWKIGGFSLDHGIVNVGPKSKEQTYYSKSLRSERSNQIIIFLLIMT